MHAERDAIVHKYAQRLAGLKKGQKGAIIAEACAELGCGRNTFYELLGVIMPSGRKTRTSKQGKKGTGAGDTAVLPEEADKVSAYIMEGFNNIDKKGRTIKGALKTLRDNGEVVCGRVDPETGEISYLSEDAVSRALVHYGVHPVQLRRPTPNANLASKHPNHVGGCDSTTGTIFFLKDGSNLFEPDKKKHYKNKPWELEAVAKWRVIRYTYVDHCTGVVRVRYYPHSENARHTVDFLAWVWAPKDHPNDPHHGAPEILYVDGGINNTLVRRFCARLGVRIIVHAPGNSRATGFIEGAHWYSVEVPFEHGLRDLKHEIDSFEELNRRVYVWQLAYNWAEVHERHGMARFPAWLHIKPEQLRETAPYKTLLTLATEKPKRCVVRGDLKIEFRSRLWCVKNVPGVMVKGDVYAHWHPFIKDTAMAVVEDENGKEIHIALEDKTGIVDPAQGQWGYIQGAAIIGETYASPPDTEIDKNRKRVRLVASESATQEEDKQKRRKKDFVAFGGRINPLKAAEEAVLPTPIKKRGTAIDTPALTIDLPPLGHRAAGRRLIEMLGETWHPEYLNEISARYPAGVPEADLDALADEFRERGEAPAKRPPLKAVK
jgi:hypothetical protein